MLLAGDVGGTKTVLALYRRDSGEPDHAGDPCGIARIAEVTEPSQDAPSLEAIAERFLRSQGSPRIEAACFGVAGAVVDGRCTTTNLPWELDEHGLESSLRIPRVKLLNDLEAMAWGVLHLPATELLDIQPGRPRSGNQVLIAAGTGLGEALIVWDGTRHLVVGSEGGHADFAARTELEAELQAYLRGEFGHVSYERVLSGPGLFNIYRFLRDTRGTSEPKWLTDRMAEEDPSAVVSEVGLAGGHPLCVQALDMFAGIYGAEAGNLALKALAVGGVFIGGGIGPKIRTKLASPIFRAAFGEKGRFASLLRSLPVRLVLEPRAPLLGAARTAHRLRLP